MSQILQITLMNLKSVPDRLGVSLVICVAIAGVVAVLVSVLAMATGLTDTLARVGEPDRVIVFRKGSLTESLSSLSREAVLAVETAPGIASAAGSLGAPAVSPEVVLSVTLPRRDQAGSNAILVRGMTPVGLAVRPEMELVEGRMFAAGRHEVIVGVAAERQFANLSVGDVVDFYTNRWQVVGTFSTNGDAAETQLVTDAATLQSAANRTVFNSVTARLASPDAFEAFEAAVSSNPRLKVQVERESDYYGRQSENAGQLLSLIAYVVGSIMAFGAVCGAVNTMYTAVAVRTVEIATLRALGFGAMPVVVSVLVEALALSLVGAVVGVLIAWLLFNGDDFVSGNTLAQVTVPLRIGGPVVAVGVIWALVIGLLGAFFPALKAARLPLVDGLRVTV